MKDNQQSRPLPGRIPHRTRPRALTLAGALALALMAAPLASADVDLEDEDFESKAIRVDNPENEPLRVALKPSQESFKVGEPIRFTARGNKDFFLYLFSVNQDTDEATLILPSKQGQKDNKYPADTDYPVPNPDVPPLVADAAGREMLVMVASTKYLPLKSNWFRDGADRYVGSAKEFEEEFEGKAIRVGRERTRNRTVFVREIFVPVVDERTAETPATDVWLTTKGNRNEYAVGDSIQAVFGAEKDGWVHLYVIDPNGERVRLKSYEVKEGASYVAKARATRPTGKHAFVAAFTGSDDDGLGAASGKSSSDVVAKGVSLEEEVPPSMAVYRFNIRSERQR